MDMQRLGRYTITNQHINERATWNKDNGNFLDI